MFKPDSAPPLTSASTRLWTTLLACAWGLASAYTLFHSLLFNGGIQLVICGLVPLVSVWAVLERKRWGRHALLGLSATALGLFTYILGTVAAMSVNWTPAERNVSNFVNTTLTSFGDNQEISLIVLALALSTGFWMRRPAVVAEFERGKRATLAVAQKAIAMSLVAFWGITVLLMPPPSENAATKSPSTKKQRPQSGKTAKDNAKRPNPADLSKTNR